MTNSTNNANLIKQLRNNAWDKPVVTKQQATEIVETFEKLSQCNKDIVTYASFSQTRRLLVEYSQELQQKLIDLGA